jgi:hypothetical protein
MPQAGTFGSGDRRRLSSRWDKIGDTGLIIANSFYDRLTWQCRCRGTDYSVPTAYGHRGQGNMTL